MGPKTNRLLFLSTSLAVAASCLAAFLLSGPAIAAEPGKAAGNDRVAGYQPRTVLSVHPEHPHLFRDPAGKPLLFVGNYTWGMFSNIDFDYRAMLDTLESSGVNFARVWLFWGDEILPEVDVKTGGPLSNITPYLRTGPGTANDGLPKYDLDRVNPAFFTRLHDVCAEAQKRGIYLQLCIFDGWLLKTPRWKNHVYQRDNNINGVDGDPNRTGQGRDNGKGFCSLNNPQSMKYQQALVRQVVDSVNHFDHIMFEIANENINPQWELAMCDYLHEYEKSKPKQHLVMPQDLPNHGMGIGVVQSWNPQVVHDGLLAKRSLQRPQIFDTDFVISDRDDQIRPAMWAGVLSGGHFDYLDASFQLGSSWNGDHRGRRRAALRSQIGILAMFARQIRFWEMEPSDDAVKQGFAIVLASRDELAAYLPQGGRVTLNLGRMKNPSEAYWCNPRSGVWQLANLKKGATGEQKLTAPGAGDWLLYVRNFSDKKPPTEPVSVQAASLSPSSVRIAWTAASDNIAVAGYDVFCNGKLVATTASPGAVVKNLKPETSYSFSAAAYDISGNRSSRSDVSPPVITPQRESSYRVVLGKTNRSVRLFHLQSRDGNTKGTQAAGEDCREPADPRGKYFYFSLDDEYFSEGSGLTVTLKATYFDEKGFIEPQYDATEGPYVAAQRIELTGERKWKTAQWKLPNCRFANRQNSGADFRLHVGENKVRIKSVEVLLEMGL